MSYLLFQPANPAADFPPGSIAVISRRGRSLLGVIYWYAPWHQHVVEPAPETVWSDECLADLQRKVAAMNAERAAGRPRPTTGAAARVQEGRR